MISFSLGFCNPPAWSPDKKISLWGAPLIVWGKRFDRAICLTWEFLSLRKGISYSHDIKKSGLDLEFMCSPRQAGRPSEINYSRDFWLIGLVTLARSLQLQPSSTSVWHMAGYNRTRYVEQLLEKTEPLPPSFTVHLHPEYWVLNNGSKFLYHNQIAVGLWIYLSFDLAFISLMMLVSSWRHTRTTDTSGFFGAIWFSTRAFLWWWVHLDYAANYYTDEC